MVGSVTLQQGPLGVAASSRRPEPRPGAAGIARVSAGTGSQLDPAHREPIPVPPPDPEQSEQNQELEGIVAPATLFETSRLAALLLPADAPLSPADGRRDAAWSPPQSTLSLHDSRA